MNLMKRKIAILEEDESQEVYSAKQIIMSNLEKIAIEMNNNPGYMNAYRDSIDNMVALNPDENFGNYRDKGVPTISPVIVYDDQYITVYSMIQGPDILRTAFRGLNEKIVIRLQHTEEVTSLPALFRIYTDYDKYVGCICVEYNREDSIYESDILYLNEGLRCEKLSEEETKLIVEYQKMFGKCAKTYQNLPKDVRVTKNDCNYAVGISIKGKKKIKDKIESYMSQEKDKDLRRGYICCATQFMTNVNKDSEERIIVQLDPKKHREGKNIVHKADPILADCISYLKPYMTSEDKKMIKATVRMYYNVSYNRWTNLSKITGGKYDAENNRFIQDYRKCLSML